MRYIKSKDTTIELLLRKELWKRGFRYRKNYSMLPGTPDIVLTKYRIVIFCDGDFFHGKNWNSLKESLKNCNNSSYWISKIGYNIERDGQIDNMLLEKGWTVIRFWETDIKNNLDKCMEIIEDTIFDLEALSGNAITGTGIKN